MKHPFRIAYLLSAMTLIPTAANANLGCSVVSEQFVELDTALALDFTARTLLNQLQGKYETQVHWLDGTKEDALLSIEYQGGSIRYVEQLFDDGGTGQEIAYPCYDQLEIDVVLQLELKQTNRIEEFQVTFTAPALEMITQYLEVDNDTASTSSLITPSDQKQITAGQARLILASEVVDRVLYAELALLQPRSDNSMAHNSHEQLIKKRLAHWAVQRP